VAASPQESWGEKPQDSTSLLYAIRAVSLAFERARLLRRIHRYAAAGEIVICDRYPSDQAGATDGPRLQIRDGKRGWRARLFNWLARYEQRLYARNAPPDVALRLNVSIETAKRRNRLRTKVDRHDDDNLEIRHQQCRAWQKTGTKVVHDIDTEASLEVTILSVKKNIWNSL
jgi:thymidylate kinase